MSEPGGGWQGGAASSLVFAGSVLSCCWRRAALAKDVAEKPVRTETTQAETQEDNVSHVEVLISACCRVLFLSPFRLRSMKGTHERTLAELSSSRAEQEEMVAEYRSRAGAAG